MKLIMKFSTFAFVLLMQTVNAESTYDPAAGTIKIESLLVSETLYKNVVVVPQTLVSIGANTSKKKRIKTNLPANYNVLNGHLSFQNLLVDETSYSDVVITIKEALSFDSARVIGTAEDFSDRDVIELNYLAASDVEQSRISATLDWTRRVTNDWFKKGNSFWEHFHPIDIWLIGPDPDAAAALNPRACERLRKSYPKRYLRDACNPNSGSGLEFSNFDQYANGGAAINSSVILDGYHWMYIGPDGPGDSVSGRTVAHEAFHMWQLAHLNVDDNEWIDDTGLTSDNSSDRESIQNILLGKETGSLSDWTPIRTANSKGKGPFQRDGAWWHEGGAEYMAISWYSRQLESKALAENDEERENYLNYQISQTVKNELQKFRDSGLKVYELAYEHGSLGYNIGFLFHAYLVTEVGLDTILNRFWDEVAKLGFDNAFLKHFGKTYQEYGLEFDMLIKKSDSEIITLLSASSKQ